MTAPVDPPKKRRRPAVLRVEWLRPFDGQSVGDVTVEPAWRARVVIAAGIAREVVAEERS